MVLVQFPTPLESLRHVLKGGHLFIFYLNASRDEKLPTEHSTLLENVRKFLC